MGLDYIRTLLQKLPLSRRIAVGYITVACLTLLCGLAGGLGIWKLGSLLQFVTGPAWDSADGAMEGSIEIEAQMIAARNLADGVSVEKNRLMLANSQEGARTAFRRLTNAGLLSRERCQEIDGWLQRYENSLSEFMQAGEKLAAVKLDLDRSASQLLPVCHLMEERGRSEMQSLQTDPAGTFSWDDQIRVRWNAAGGSAALLNACTSQLSSIARYFVDGDSAAFEAAWSSAKILEKSALDQIMQTASFDQPTGEHLLSGQFKDRRLRDVYSELQSEFREKADLAVSVFRAHQTKRIAYDSVCEEFLEYVAVVEEEADGTVESMTSSITASKMAAFAAIGLSLAASLVVSIVAGRLCTASVTVPITAAIDVMQEHAHSNATAVQEMLASIQSIAGNTESAAANSRNASDVARRGVENVKNLGHAASQISSIADLIQSIAEQTNLLALNATIEAARAGDSGKGFAVVAHEVKELAKQTAAATGNINRQIQEVCSISTAAAVEISQIHDVILQVDEINQQIRAAVEQQNSTTQEISRSVIATSDAASAVVLALGER